MYIRRCAIKVTTKINHVLNINWFLISVYFYVFLFILRNAKDERAKYHYNKAIKKLAQLTRRGLNNLLKDVANASSKFDTFQDFAKFFGKESRSSGV